MNVEARSHAYPAPWRMPPDGADATREALVQSAEEERFHHIMAEARDANVPIENLLRATLNLAFPNASREDVDRAHARVMQELTAWQSALDNEGNPAWLTLASADAEDDPALRPETILPEGHGKAYPEETAVPVKEKKKRPSIFYGIIALVRGLFGLRQEIDNDEPAAPTPPVLKIIRIAFFALFFLSTYKYLVKHGIITPFW
ncbi:hypothetical protein LJC46_03680 [Desulfovibrio sp. OttesenSCG-928-G15]|nr:hypothetical protein [Desulfovibrio sp. OttesenSCG-928-G15]